MTNGKKYSIISRRGQTSIPAHIRRQMGWKPGAKLAWRAEGNMARAFALPDDPIKALQGSLKGIFSTKELLEERRKERERER